MTVDSYRPPSEHGGRAPEPGAAAPPLRGLTGPAAAAHVLRPDALGTGMPVAAAIPWPPSPRTASSRPARTPSTPASRPGCLGVRPFRHRELRGGRSSSSPRPTAGSDDDLGLGVWPPERQASSTSATAAGDMPDGLLRTVVPAAPDAWITALERSGTMSFAEVAQRPPSSPGDGFPLGVRRGDHHGARGRTPVAHVGARSTCPGPAASRGRVLVQPDLGGDAPRLAAAARRGGRAARPGRGGAERFYRGETAAAIARYPRGRGRLSSTMGGLAGSGWVSSHQCGPSSAPARDLGVRLLVPGPGVAPGVQPDLDGVDLVALGHNSPAYLHRLVEAIKLAFADRECVLRRPAAREVPADGLLSRPTRRAPRAHRSASERVARDAAARAIRAARPRVAACRSRRPAAGADALDTILRRGGRRHGNGFSATPSDRPTSTRRSSPASGCVVSGAARRAGSIPGTRASSRRASGRGSRRPGHDLARRQAADAVRHAGR